MQWKDYGDGYRVSDTGTILSRPFLKGNKRKIIDTHINYAGYERVRLVVNGKKINLKVHRVVADLFVPNPTNAETVNHKDGNKLNNAADNLEWVSIKENNEHAFNEGLKKRFPIAVVDVISGLTAEFKSVLDASRKTGVSRPTIHKYLDNGEVFLNRYFFKKL